MQPDAKDKRFADPAWPHPLWRRVSQSYLVTRASVLGSVDVLGLDVKSADRARFALSQITEATAPTNNLLGNPAALKRAAQTRGRSLVDGSRHFLHDVRHNGGMPSQVDTRPFRVGETVAVDQGRGRAPHAHVRADPVRADHGQGLRRCRRWSSRPRSTATTSSTWRPERSFVEYVVEPGHPDLPDLVAQSRPGAAGLGHGRLRRARASRRCGSPPTSPGPSRST